MPESVRSGCSARAITSLWWEAEDNRSSLRIRYGKPERSPSIVKAWSDFAKVIIWDDGRAKAVITLEFRSVVHKVALSRSRIVVALQNSVHIYAFSSPPKKLSSFETADNPLGLCCLGQKLIAFPGRTHGQVQLVEVESGNVSIIPAHSTPLKALALSPDGESLATASETGTIIRTFSTSNCSKKGEFRRGVDKAVVYSLAFSPDNSLLATTSDKSTLHVFDVSRPITPSNTKGGYASSIDSSEDSNPAASNQKYGFLSRLPLLPRVFSDVYSSCSTQFSTDDADPVAISSSGTTSQPISGMPGGRAPKGVIGWLNDWTVLVIGAGRDGRWEKFMLGEDERGRRLIGRRGWKRYLGGS